MSESVLNAVADAVVESLNQATFSLSFAAARHYQPKFELKEMNELHVSVVPRGIVEKRISRSLTAFDCGIDIGVQQRVGTEKAQLDALSNLVTEIRDHVRDVKLPEYPRSPVIELMIDPVFAPEHLDELRQFTSVVRVTYRVWQ